MDAPDGLPPGPYSYMTMTRPGGRDGDGFVYIVDAAGKKIATLLGTGRQKIALAALIIEARDRI